MVTLLCCIAASPRSPLTLLFFLVIISAPLRLSLPLVYAATFAAAGGYLFQLAYYAWYLIGWERYYASPELRIPHSIEAIHVLALLAAGLLAGQVVRQTRRIAGTRIIVSPELPAQGGGST
jgi:hypothetical protein